MPYRKLSFGKTHSIRALILGGTELPLLLRDADIGVPWLDTTRIHVARAVEELLQ